MPWSDYPPVLRQFSGLVNAAAQAQYGAAATSQLIGQAAKAAGISLGFSDYTSLQKLYSNYVKGRVGGEVLGAAQDVVSRTGIDQGITSQMLWTPPYGPSVGPAGPGDFVLVKVQYTRETPTGPITGIFSHQYMVADLHTVGGVLADTQAQMDAATGETNLQGATATGIVSIERVFP